MRRTIDFVPSLTKASGDDINNGDINIEIAAPSTYLAGKGPGSKDRDGRRITTNSISAVVRLKYKGEPVALLPGDIDGVGLDDIITHETDISSPIIIFPHHGGKISNTDLVNFTEKICDIVKPTTVVFSTGSGRYETPQPEIVETIRKILPDTRIACTQISEHCAHSLSETELAHLYDTFSSGCEKKHCCGGTIIVDLDDIENIRPSNGDHASFIEANAKTALCI